MLFEVNLRNTKLVRDKKHKVHILLQSFQEKYIVCVKHIKLAFRYKVYMKNIMFLWEIISLYEKHYVCMGKIKFV